MQVRVDRDSALREIYHWVVYIMEGMPVASRLFKTKRFATDASKAWISDEELREAFSQMLAGQARWTSSTCWI